MPERKSPPKGAHAGRRGTNSTVQKRTAQHAAVADGAGPRYPLRSTAVEVQRQRILVALRTGPKTSYDLRRLGCYQAPTRIIELRRMGYDIRTQLVTLYDRDGYVHPRCARYHLMGEVG